MICGIYAGFKAKECSPYFTREFLGLVCDFYFSNEEKVQYVSDETVIPDDECDLFRMVLELRHTKIQNFNISLDFLEYGHYPPSLRSGRHNLEWYEK